MRKIKVSAIIVISFAMITAFQNCSSGNGMNFASQSSTASQLSQSGTVSTTGNPTGPTTPPVVVNPPVVTPPSQPPVVVNPPVLSPPTIGAPNVCDAPFIAVGGSCVCPGGENSNGTTCVSCAANQIFDSGSKACVSRCAAGSNFNGNSCVTCASTEAWDGKQCVTPSATCKSYKEVQSPFVIPPRDLGQTCYYVKMSHAYGYRNSTGWTARESSVESRDHNDYSNLNPIHPYIIGSAANDAGAIGAANFSLQGAREIILAGDDFGGQDINVDNFILVTANVNGVQSAFGEGTGDAVTYKNAGVAGDDGAIHVGGKDLVNYYVGAAGGTATFSPIDLADPAKAFHLPLNTQINLKTEALDCGGSGGASDIYLMFR